MFRTVGEQPFVKVGQHTKPAALRKTIYLGVDVPLLLIVFTLAIFGLVMVFSASYDYSLWFFDSANHIFIRQLLWMALGTTLAAVLTFVDYHLLRKIAVPAMAVTIVLLVAVLFGNESVNGSVRTFFKGSVQPSELAKLMTVIYLGVWLFSKRDQLDHVGFGLFPLAAILGLLAGLIFLQPDLSAVITILFLGGVMFFLADGDLKQISIMFVLAFLVGLLVVQVSNTGSDRMSNFQAGWSDPMNASYHVRRSLEAFVSGRWLGVGIGKSVTKLTGLPVPSTDSIFAVIGEETGTLGAVMVIGMYVLLLWRGLTIAQRATDQLGRLLAAGLTIWITVEAFINMAVMVNLLPFAGNALPFISSGGSSLIATFTAIGILLSISRLSMQERQAEGRSYSAVVDLRRWDRRRRVPGARRAPGAVRGK